MDKAAGYCRLLLGPDGDVRATGCLSLVFFETRPFLKQDPLEPLQTKTPLYMPVQHLKSLFLPGFLH